MKKLLIALLILTSCAHKPTVQEAIAKYLKNSLSHPESYEPVEFSQPTIFRKVFYNTPEYAKMVAARDSFGKIADVYLDSAKYYDALTDKSPAVSTALDNWERKAIQQMNRADEVNNEIKLKAKTFTDTIIMTYEVYHKYKSKNEYGVVELHNCKFRIDGNMKVKSAKFIE